MGTIVIARSASEEAIQLRAPVQGLDCFAPLAMTSGAHSKGVLHPRVIARSASDEAIQLPALARVLDCFAPLAMTGKGRAI